MKIRHFEITDIRDLQKYRYPEKSDIEILTMINDWNRGGCSGRYFEMFTITDCGSPVGEVFVYEHNDDTVSVGVNVYEPYRRKGYASFGVNEVLKIATKKGYFFANSLIEKHNKEGLSLFRKLGFEPIGEFIDPRGAMVYTYKKFIKQ